MTCLIENCGAIGNRADLVPIREAEVAAVADAVAPEAVLDVAGQGATPETRIGTIARSAEEVIAAAARVLVKNAGAVAAKRARARIVIVALVKVQTESVVVAQVRVQAGSVVAVARRKVIALMTRMAKSTRMVAMKNINREVAAKVLVKMMPMSASNLHRAVPAKARGDNGARVHVKRT